MRTNRTRVGFARNALRQKGPAQKLRTLPLFFYRQRMKSNRNEIERDTPPERRWMMGRCATARRRCNRYCGAKGGTKSLPTTTATNDRPTAPSPHKQPPPRTGRSPYVLRILQMSCCHVRMLDGQFISQCLFTQKIIARRARANAFYTNETPSSSRDQ